MRDIRPATFPEHLRSSAADPSVARDFRAGRVVRLVTGWYCDTTKWREAPPWERHVWVAAAVRLAQPQLLLCSSSSLAIHGMALIQTPQLLHLATTSWAHLGRQPQTFRAAASAGRVPTAPRRFLHLHRGPDGGEPAAVVVNGFRTRPLIDSLMEFVSAASLEASLAVLDSALSLPRSCRVNRDDLQEAALLWPVAVRRERILRVLGLADAGAESAGESLSRAFMLRQGFALPQLQHEFFDSGGFVARADCWWPGLGIVGEFDGRDKWVGELAHRGAGQFEAVRASHDRQARLQSHPEVNRVLRWTWDELKDPSRLVDKFLAAGVPRDPSWVYRAA